MKKNHAWLIGWHWLFWGEDRPVVRCEDVPVAAPGVWLGPQMAGVPKHIRRSLEGPNWAPNQRTSPKPWNRRTWGICCVAIFQWLSLWVLSLNLDDHLWSTYMSVTAATTDKPQCLAKDLASLIKLHVPQFLRRRSCCKTGYVIILEVPTARISRRTKPAKRPPAK